MTLLEFARGPALEWSAFIFVVGLLWRLGGLLFLAHDAPLSKDKRPDPWKGGRNVVFSRFRPAEVFRKRVAFQYIANWIWHVGFVIVLFFFELHIVFFEGLLGFSWPALPNSVILFVAALSAGILLILLVRRMTSPLLRYISNFNDYSSLVVTLLPFITGLATFMHIGIRYETLLALHFLSVALLLVWFPFSKLVHVVTMLPARYFLGVKFWRRGVDL